MTLKATLLAAGTAAALGLAGTAPILAHGPGAADPTCGWHYGWHAGPMTGQGMDQGMMGQGMGPGMGQGTMGQGTMGQGMGPGMGQGMGPGAMAPLREDLSAADVTHMLEHRLAWHGNPNVKLGSVEETDADTVTAEIVTKDGSLVQRLEVDRHTGWMRPAQ